MSKTICNWMWLFCASMVGLGAAAPKVSHCPELTDAHEQAMEEVVLDLAEGRIGEQEALERMKQIIPPQCHPAIVDRQDGDAEGDAR